jgi:hypothetical protein
VVDKLAPGIIAKAAINGTLSAGLAISATEFAFHSDFRRDLGMKAPRMRQLKPYVDMIGMDTKDLFTAQPTGMLGGVAWCCVRFLLTPSLTCGLTRSS